MTNKSAFCKLVNVDEKSKTQNIKASDEGSFHIRRLLGEKFEGEFLDKNIDLSVDVSLPVCSAVTREDSNCSISSAARPRQCLKDNELNLNPRLSVCRVGECCKREAASRNKAQNDDEIVKADEEYSRSHVLRRKCSSGYKPLITTSCFPGANERRFTAQGSKSFPSSWCESDDGIVFSFGSLKRKTYKEHSLIRELHDFCQKEGGWCNSAIAEVDNQSTISKRQSDSETHYPFQYAAGKQVNISNHLGTKWKSPGYTQPSFSGTPFCPAVPIGQKGTCREDFVSPIPSQPPSRFDWLSYFGMAALGHSHNNLNILTSLYHCGSNSEQPTSLANSVSRESYPCSTFLSTRDQTASTKSPQPQNPSKLFYGTWPFSLHSPNILQKCSWKKYHVDKTLATTDQCSPQPEINNAHIKTAVSSSLGSGESEHCRIVEGE